MVKNEEQGFNMANKEKNRINYIPALWTNKDLVVDVYAYCLNNRTIIRMILAARDKTSAE